MKTLFIDTHLFDINIMLFENDILISEGQVNGEKHNSKYLLPTIKKVCDGRFYDEIIVVNGPGSFTGVRLGVTVAKTLAYTQNIPIKTISSLDQMAYSYDSGHYHFAISDGNGYFIGEYNEYIQVNDYYYLSNTEFLDFIKNHKVVTDVSIDYKNCLKMISNKKAKSPHAVNPIYIKLIGVENGKKN